MGRFTCLPFSYSGIGLDLRRRSPGSLDCLSTHAFSVSSEGSGTLSPSPEGTYSVCVERVISDCLQWNDRGHFRLARKAICYFRYNHYSERRVFGRAFLFYRLFESIEKGDGATAFPIRAITSIVSERRKMSVISRVHMHIHMIAVCG